MGFRLHFLPQKRLSGRRRLHPGHNHKSIYPRCLFEHVSSSIFGWPFCVCVWLWGLFVVSEIIRFLSTAILRASVRYPGNDGSQWPAFSTSQTYYISDAIFPFDLLSFSPIFFFISSKIKDELWSDSEKYVRP